MRALTKVFLSIFLSLVFYGATFTFLVKKPLTIGFIHDAFQVKAAYANKIRGPKVIIVAGSNGLFSFRCEVMEPILKRPCLNASVTVILGLKLTLKKAQEFLKAGDVILMPFEYNYYYRNFLPASGYNYLLSYEPEKWLSLPLAEKIPAIFSFDFHYLISGIVETLLRTMGIQRKFHAAMLTQQGDMSGHTALKARQFQKSIGEPLIPTPEEIDRKHAYKDYVINFFKWAAKNKIRIFGILPTTIDTKTVSAQTEKKIAQLYTRNGQSFIFQPNRGQYSRECFFDTHYHLHEACQIKHSISVANFLKQRL